MEWICLGGEVIITPSLTQQSSNQFLNRLSLQRKYNNYYYIYYNQFLKILRNLCLPQKTPLFQFVISHSFFLLKRHRLLKSYGSWECSKSQEWFEITTQWSTYKKPKESLQRLNSSYPHQFCGTQGLIEIHYLCVPFCRNGGERWTSVSGARCLKWKSFSL